VCPRYCASIVATALYLGWVSCPFILAQELDSESPPAAGALPKEQAWLARLPDAPSAPGALDGERVYVPISGRLVALERTTGRLTWTADIDTPWPPVVAGTSLWVGTATHLIELDPEDGTRRQAVLLESPLTAPVSAAPPYLFLSTADGSLTAINMPDGAVRWRVATGGVSRVGAAAASDAVVVALEDARVLAMTLADGRLRWTRTLTGTLGLPAIAAGRVLVGSSDNAVYALEAQTGDLAWRRATGGDVLGIVALERTAYVVSRDHVIVALDAASGNLRWRQVTPTRPVAGPCLVEGVLAIAGLDPILAGYETGSGRPAGTFVFGEGVDPSVRLAGPPLAAPAVRAADAVIAVVTRDGQVVGLRAATAEPPPASP
jgi:outer membrane protein assembly factor BamB